MGLYDLLSDVDAIDGWDWSRCRTRTGPFGWDYVDVLRSHACDAEQMLDVGTGGGEVFSQVARPGDVGLDFSVDMLYAARARLAGPLVAGDHGNLPFAAGSFDLVADRHVGCPPDQVRHVLRPGGIYVAQDPGERICQNIFDALGWGSNGAFWQQESGVDYWPAARRADYLQAADFDILRFDEANVDHVFEDDESLAFWLLNAPLPPLPDNPDLINNLPRATNWHATLLLAQAPSA